MRIHVSDIAKVYGITKQTLHYYESRGVLKPLRDTVNGYRYYQESDLQKLGTIKKLRNAGFELSLSLDMQNGMSSNRLQDIYRERKNQIYQAIQNELRVVKQLDEDLAAVERCNSEGSLWRLEHMEAQVRYEFFDEGLIMTEPDTRTQAAPWFEHIFFTAASYMLYCDSRGNYDHFSRGLITTSQLAAQLNIPITENVTVMPAGEYATAMFHFSKKSDFQNAGHFKAMLSSLHSCRGFEPAGQLFTRTIQIFLNELGDMEYYLKAIVPVK